MNTGVLLLLIAVPPFGSSSSGESSSHAGVRVHVGPTTQNRSLRMGGFLRTLKVTGDNNVIYFNYSQSDSSFNYYNKQKYRRSRRLAWRRFR